jgi:hypothetical protein
MPPEPDISDRPPPYAHHAPASSFCRIGLVTYHFVPNYGAVWQAWALQQALQNLGHDVSVIDYRPRHVFEGGSFKWPTSKRRLRANLVVAYQNYLRFRGRFGYRKQLVRSFEDFQSRYLRLSDQRYRSLRDLREVPPLCDTMICGSDQIWNPSVQAGLDPAYFLRFGGPEIRRIAYAASFGRRAIEAEYLEQVGRWVGSFDAISIREASGRNVLDEAGVSAGAVHVPDPTLLIDDYPDQSPLSAIPEAYLMSYVLRSGDRINQMQRQVAQRTSLPLMSPRNPHSVASTADMLVTPSPIEWLGLIRRAHYVITNSFHGTLFSIIFRKPFVSVSIGSGKATLNERVVSLFDRLGLEDRFVAEADSNRVVQLLETPVDWDRVHGAIHGWREQALDYLRASLA